MKSVRTINRFIFLILLSIIYSCNGDDDMSHLGDVDMDSPMVVPTEISFDSLGIDNITDNIVFDSFNDVMYFVGHSIDENNSKLIRLNYRTLEVENRIILPYYPGEYTLNHSIYNNNPELYLASEKNLFIYDAELLTVIDSVGVFTDESQRGRRIDLFWHN